MQKPGTEVRADGVRAASARRERNFADTTTTSMGGQPVVRRALAKPRSVAMKRSSIGTMSFTGSAAGCPVSRASTAA